MKAAVIRKIGSVDNVKVEEVADPQPEAGEVLVSVKAAALNHLDIWVTTKRGQIADGKYILVGSDATGVVASVGDGVNNVKIGDEVIVNPGLSCGQCEHCHRGQQSECGSYGILGLSRAGTFAEQVTVPAVSLAAKPGHMNWEEAAALPLAHLTAWRMLMSRAKLHAGESLLIHGIGGGAALAALQIAGVIGVETIVTSSSDDKLEKARDLGADHCINYKTGDVAGDVMSVTNGRGVDVAFDTVGAATLPVNLEVLVKGGRMVICGVTSGAEPAINLQQIYWKQLNIMGSTMGSHEEFRAMVKATGDNKITPVIDSVLPLADVQKALTRMEKGEQFGKIVLSVA